MQTYGMDRILDDEAPTPKVSASREFLVDIKKAANCIGCYSPLRAIEDGVCSILSSSARYNNILARVIFKEGLLADKLRTDPSSVVSALSFADIDHLHKHLLLIQLNILNIGEHQGLKPIGRRALTFGMALNVLNENATDGYVVRGSSYSQFEGNSEFELKKELLTDMLKQFERKVGTLLSVVRVKNLSVHDKFSMEKIDNAIDTLRPLFHSVGVP